MSVLHFLQLLFVKVGLNLKSEASKSYLSYVWWILEPALFVAVFYLVFGVLMERGGPDFVAFLVCGKIPFLWFSRSVTNSSSSIMSGKQLISQVYIPKIFFPLVVILQDSVKQCFVFLLLLAFLVFYGTDTTMTWLYLPIVVVTQGLLISASALVAASIVPVFPDFRYIINTGLMLLMFGSGIFYDYKEVVQTEYHEIFLANPIAALLESYRLILLDGSAPDFSRLLAIAAASIGIVFTMWYLLKRFHGEYSRLAMQ